MRSFFLVIFSFLISYNTFANDKVVTVAFRDSPPFEFVEDGEIVGINKTTIYEVLKRAGYEATFVPLPWKRALVSVENGDLDAIASIKMSEARKSQFIFSDPLIYTRDYFFKNKKLNIAPKSLDDLTAYKIGTVEKYYYGDKFDATQFSKLSPIASSTPEVDNLEKLQSGRIDLALCPIDICTYWVKKYPKLFSNIDYIESPTVSSTQSLYIAFSRKNSIRSNEIVKKFNIELEKYIAEGNVKRNIEKYNLDGQLTLSQDTGS